MINLLRRIFVKDYINVGDAKVRTAHGQLASFFGVVTNLVLFAVKLVFGILALTNWPIYKSCGQNYIFGVLNSTLLGLAKQTTFGFS